MKIFVTGATGVVGPPTVRDLVTAGHDVLAVARDEDKARALRRAGARPVTVDLFDRAAVHDATRGCEAIAHLATHVPPVRSAARKGAWDLHNRLRTEATTNLVAAARAHEARAFVKESVTFSYPDRGDQWIDEDTAPDASTERLRPTLDGERLALDFADGSERRAVVVRFGLFYGGSTNRGTDEMLRLARFRMSTVAGRPDAFMSSIHADDAAAAVVAALDVATGVYNVVDDEPLTRRDYLGAFATAFGVPRPRPAPGWLLRLVGGPAARVLLASQRVANRRFRHVTAWAPRHPNAREGWAATARAREAMGVGGA